MPKVSAVFQVGIKNAEINQVVNLETGERMDVSKLEAEDIYAMITFGKWTFCFEDCLSANCERKTIALRRVGEDFLGG